MSELSGKERQALERLIGHTKRDSGQSRRVADFLLAWWLRRKMFLRYWHEVYGISQARGGIIHSDFLENCFHLYEALGLYKLPCQGRSNPFFLQ